ncbi:DUF1543 domain-containing protein [Mucilaginibacter sp. CAU 1740]|uniref:DUF1543 domain-containing protein n=1 Tax=Mucilaginibacter sp. CAU 1740 TaxID=3140365 RepID=UPI00325C31B5
MIFELKSFFALHAFWPEAGSSLHIDGWREVTHVDGYRVEVRKVSEINPDLNNGRRLFFVNLGGYQTAKLEEQHYTLLTVQEHRKGAIKTSTLTNFFKQQTITAVKSASAHIDEKYGIDVDEIYQIDDVLAPVMKLHYRLVLTPIL